MFCVNAYVNSYHEDLLELLQTVQAQDLHLWVPADDSMWKFMCYSII